MYSMLLDKTNAPLSRLSLHRIQLDQYSSCEIMEIEGDEALLYSLVGCAQVCVDGLSVGKIGGRRSILDPAVQAVRIPTACAGHLQITLEGYAADLLCVTCAPLFPLRNVDPQPPYVHRQDVDIQLVGQQTYAREVRVLPQPAGYSIYTGETLSHGGWSSFPAHATQEDRAHYADWEELFFVVSNGYGMIHLDGRYCTGETVNEARLVHNGDAFPTVLGSHPIVFMPNTWGYYWWGYIGGHVLEKTYNRWSTDTGVYIR